MVDAHQQTPTAPALSPSLVQRMNADPSDALTSAPVSVVQVGRPMPLPKSKAMSRASNGPSLIAQAKKAIFGSRAVIDPRQKKAAVLVGILSLVFGVVMFVSLGGVGAKQAAAGQTTDGDQSSQNQQSTKKTAQNWESPAPLPHDLRNAASPVKARSVEQQANETAETSDLVVKGILFSKNRPSAIINNEILTEGQVYNGAKIIKITKDTVEFEASQKRWTQMVQR